MKKSWEWEREDLDNLIGQMESMRLEFKSSQIFSKKEDEIAKDLSKEVSAFANSEGGVLIIGIQESGEKPRQAAFIDQGIEVRSWSPERVQSKIEGNISPLLSGVRVKPIFLDVEQTKCAYVIYVPPGNTAYQAKDKLYYGRSEYEAKALPDHEIRLRMFRGKVPSAKILVKNRTIYVVDQTDIIARSEPKGHRSLPAWSFGEERIKNLAGYRYSFDILLENLSEINITEFKVEISSSERSGIWSGLGNSPLLFKDGLTKYDGMGLKRPTELNIYPGDDFRIESRSFTVLTENLSSYSLIMCWKLYLKDTFPITGEINMRDLFESVPLPSN